MSVTNPPPPLISIALCTYNGANFLEQQMDSLVAQSYSNIEIVIVDDCSSDDTILILEMYQQGNIRLYKNEQNIGFNKNFERCLKKCKGQYICIADQDDEWHSDKVQTLYQSLDSSLMTYADSALMNEQGELLNQTMSQLLKMKFETIYSPLELVYVNMISGHAMLFDQKILQSALPIPDGVFYDWWLAFVAVCVGDKINYVDAQLVHHRKHDNSAISYISREQSLNQKSNLKYQKHLQRCKNLSAFKEFEVLKTDDKAIIGQLYQLSKDRETQGFSIKLFFLLARHSKQLFLKYRYKALLNRWNHCLKEAKAIIPPV